MRYVQTVQDSRDGWFTCICVGIDSVFWGLCAM